MPISGPYIDTCIIFPKISKPPTDSHYHSVGPNHGPVYVISCLSPIALLIMGSYDDAEGNGQIGIAWLYRSGLSSAFDSCWFEFI